MKKLEVVLKVEVIFAQVKKGTKNENMDISSDSVMQILEALRNNSDFNNDSNSVIFNE